MKKFFALILGLLTGGIALTIHHGSAALVWAQNATGPIVNGTINATSGLNPDLAGHISALTTN